MRSIHCAMHPCTAYAPALPSGSPLSAFSACEQTWIQGRRYFDGAHDLTARQAYAKERAELIAHASAAKILPAT